MSVNDQSERSELPREGPGIASGPAGMPLAPRTFKQRLLRLAIQAAALLSAFLFCGVLLVGAAGWYTSRPKFCSSCHIMKPYYASWEHSSHKDVSCIKCHFPPGVGEKVRGKLLGLVQLAKYVTSSEGPRPAAEIPDASCLRSGCHEARLLSGRVEYKGVSFDHAPHLEQTRRGKQLRCTSCHGQIVQGDHMTVTASTCFLCHFKNGFFNEGLGACTRCHQIPDQEFDLGGGVTFHHDLAYEKGVDCANCHGDLIRGNGEVPRERCTVCHNRENDLKRIDDHEFLHDMHVTKHDIDCLSCHLEIHHALDPQKIAHAASDCGSCHLKQHNEQLSMLAGIGAKSIPAGPSVMSFIRVACPTCHREKEISPTGTVLMKASLRVCSTCHSDEEVAELQTYHSAIREAVGKFAPAMEPVGKAIAAAELSADRKAALAAQFAEVQHDAAFLLAANDIHNSHYASMLATTLVDRLTGICRELKIEPPALPLPPRPIRKSGRSATEQTKLEAAKTAAESTPPAEKPAAADAPGRPADKPSPPAADTSPAAASQAKPTAPSAADPASSTEKPPAAGPAAKEPSPPPPAEEKPPAAAKT